MGETEGEGQGLEMGMVADGNALVKGLYLCSEST